MKFKFRGIFIIYFILIILLIVSYRIKDTMEKNAKKSINLVERVHEFNEVSYVYEEDDNSIFNFIIENNQGNYTIIGKNYINDYCYNLFFLELDKDNNIINKKSYDSLYNSSHGRFIYLKQLLNDNYVLYTINGKIILDKQGNIIEKIGNDLYIQAQDTRDGYVLFKFSKLEKYNQYGNLEYEKAGDFYITYPSLYLDDRGIIKTGYNEIVKYDSGGNIIWSKKDTTPRKIALASNGDIIKIGQQRFSQQKKLIYGEDDFYVYNKYIERIDGKTGEILWKTEYGGNNYVLGNKPKIIEPNIYDNWAFGRIELLSVIETDNENLIVLGRYYEEKLSLFLAKLDKNGNKLGETIISDTESSKIITGRRYEYSLYEHYLYQNDDNIIVLGSVSLNNGYIINIDSNNDFNINFKTYDRDLLKTYNYDITAIRIILILIEIAIVYEIIRFLDPFVKRRNTRIPSEDYLRNKYAK